MTAQTLTLTDFLLARIAEDEAVAESSVERGYQPGWEWLADLGVNHEHRQHIAHWDPVRVLAECEAKRRIVRLCSMLLESFDHKTHWEDVNRRERHHARVFLESLALPYADHPDYRDEWRP